MSKESATAMLNASIPAPTEGATLGGNPGLQPVPEAPKQEALESTRFAHLAKKEVELQKQRESFKKEQESLTQEREKMKAIHKKLQDFDEMKLKDPVAALKLAGFTETDLFNFIAAAEDNSTPEQKATKAAQAEINKFKEEQSKKEQEAQTKRNTEVLDSFRKDIQKQIASDKDKYEYCNYNGPLAEELIYETVAAVLEESKEVISVQEAAEMVESYYEEQDKAMSNLKKRKPKEPETVIQPQDEPLRAQVSPRPSTPSKTLSSKTTASVASTVTRKETHAEKRQRLIETLGNLGKK